MWSRDGVLTPAQSVLGAIQGLRVAQPDISTCEFDLLAATL